MPCSGSDKGEVVSEYCMSWSAEYFVRNAIQRPKLRTPRLQYYNNLSNYNTKGDFDR